MKSRYLSILTACLLAAACSPSIEEIRILLNAHISGLGEDGATLVTSLEQTEKNIFSGTYSVSKDTLTSFVYPFTAIVKKDQVTQFFKDTDETKVKVVNKQTGAEETKSEYDKRLKREEAERIAAEKAEKARMAAAAAKKATISFPMTINFPGTAWALSQNNWNGTFYFKADGSVYEDWGTDTDYSYWENWSGGRNGKLLAVKSNRTGKFWLFSFSENKVYFGTDDFYSKQNGLPFRVIK